MTPKIPTVRMTNGLELPLLGYGTSQTKDESNIKPALIAALDAGYRLIDTAYAYGNEHIIGETLEEYFKNSTLKREDVFIITKLPSFSHKAGDVPKSVEEQLKKLRTTYIDLYLIHSPCPNKGTPSESLQLDADGFVIEEDVDHLETWRAMEGLYKEGKLKSIGLSNFNEQQISHIIENSEIKPQNLQVECHILFPQNELFEFCKKHGITFTGYAPIGSPGRRKFSTSADWPEGNAIGHPTVKKIAEKHKKTPAQVLLRQLVQRGISAIPKSGNPTRVRENMDIFDFELDSEDIKKLSEIGPHVRLFVMKYRFKHSKYPYFDVLEAKKYSKQ